MKADAYGHGAIECVKVAEASGVSYVGVATLEEAQELRLNGGTSVDILVLGPMLPNQFAKALGLGITLALTDMALAQELSAAAQREGRTARVHVKVDTGMSRVGFPWPTAARDIATLGCMRGLDLEGIFTHFATSEAPDKAYVRTQYERFWEVLERLEAAGVGFRYRHCSNSGAILDLADMALDLVRPGIILYGLRPSDEAVSCADLKPVMRLVSRVTRVMKWPAGTPVSYGSTYVTGSDETLATIPIGYADGYSRLLSGRADVLVHGERCRIVGRVCMDQCIVRLPLGVAGDVGVGDEAVLVGTQERQSVPMEELASHMGTINYEIACMIDKRVPRVFLHGGELRGIRALGF